ncbi:MAG TPA: GNAT family protein, partial [Bacteroidia bacterium]|nr:GNAT family protein [Bacteroidia bacterium]
TGILNDGTSHMFMIVDKKSGKDIGTVKIHNHDKVNGICNLGMMIGNRNFWGSGYGPDTLKAAISYAFNNLNVRKICESVHSNNPRALLMDLKIGFHVEGVLKDQFFTEGKYVDKILIALFAKDWNRK